MRTTLRFIQQCEHRRPPSRPYLEQVGSGHLEGGSHVALYEVEPPRCAHRECDTAYKVEVAVAPEQEGVIPIQQPPAEDLRNAVQILEEEAVERLAPEDYAGDDNMRAARLVRSALEKLGEPTPLAVQKVQALAPVALDEREARDLAVVVLLAQLEGR